MSKKDKRKTRKTKRRPASTEIVQSAEPPTKPVHTPPRTPALDLNLLVNPDPDVRDYDRETQHCLEHPDRRDAECVRLIVDHVLNSKLLTLANNSHLGSANGVLLHDAITILSKLTA